MSRRLECGFVAVHAGAGYHPLSTRAATLRACKEACKRAQAILMENETESSAVDACVAATMVLEDDPVTNAGLGSNLTMDEKVECDAGLMDGGGMRFAGVGCVRNVKNPIAVCKKMLEMQTIQNGNSLVPPNLLAGDGATAFARKYGLENVGDEDLITKRSVSGFRKALETISNSDSNPKLNGLLDTIGVIVVNNRGQVAASCSSGGPLLKMPGRIGHSAQFGCGAWAEQPSVSNPHDLFSLAIGCTGCGEYLTRTSMARTIAQRMRSQSEGDDGMQNAADTLARCLREDYLDSPLLNGMEETRKVVGAIVLKTELISEDEFLIDFAYGHRSSSMCIAYLVPSKSAHGVSVRCLMSESGNSSVVAGGGIYRLKMKKDDD